VEKMKKSFYVVTVGHEIGIYHSWDAAYSATEGYPKNRVEKFDNYDDAKEAYESCSRFGYLTKKTYQWSPNIPPRR
jgi:viroplasmin and RNaseH domain-containing protein